MGSCGLVIDGGYGEINNNSNKSRSSLPVLDGGLPSGGSCGWLGGLPCVGVTSLWGMGWQTQLMSSTYVPLSPRGPRETPDPPLPYPSNWFRTQGGKWGLAPQSPGGASWGQSLSAQFNIGQGHSFHEGGRWGGAGGWDWHWGLRGEWSVDRILPGRVTQAESSPAQGWAHPPLGAGERLRQEKLQICDETVTANCTPCPGTDQNVPWTAG